MINTLSDLDLKNKTILYRSPYDIGVTKKDGKLVVKDDSRIKATLPTLEYLLEQNCKIAIMTWVKRPENGVDEKLRTIPHAECLSSLLNHPVEHIDECVGEKVQTRLSILKPKEILMLENTRFHKEEFEDDDIFAKELTQGYDYIVFDGFPQSHRKHASTTGILRHLPACIGLYFQKELESLSKVLDNPNKPVTAIIGGAKISDKVDAISNLIKIADIVLVGGGPANVFMAAQGRNLGNSFIEEDVVDNNLNKNWINIASELKERTTKDRLNLEYNIEFDIDLETIQLPIDLVIGTSPTDDTETKLVLIDANPDTIPDGWGAYDIGPVTANLYAEIIKKSHTVLWAGTPGIFELPNYANGTKKIAEAISSTQGMSIVAGGETIEAINKFGTPEQIDHISLAGGATLQFLAGKNMPVIDLLNT